MLDNLNVHNAETQVLSLELLTRQPIPPALQDKVLDLGPMIENDAKPVYIKITQSMTQHMPDGHSEFIRILYQTLKAGNESSVTLTLSHLDHVTLTENELSGAIANVCRFRENTQVWGIIRSDLTRYAEAHPALSPRPDPNRICSG